MVDSTFAPECVIELADACARYVQRAIGIELDFTPDTLPLVDHYLDTAKKEFAQRPELEPIVIAAAAAYFGEVVRRERPHARWAIPDQADHASWRIEFDHVFLYFHPLGVVLEYLAGKEVEGSGAHLETLARDRGLLEQSLSRVGGVRESDYVRLAVRYEVIEQVSEALGGASLARGGAERFSADVYRSATAVEPVKNPLFEA